MGISPMGMNDIPAMVEAKDTISYNAGRMIMQLIEDDWRPSKYITRQSLENAIASTAASGGSTNAVLHTLAFAREAGIPFTIDDIEAVSSRTPLLVDMKPTGKYRRSMPTTRADPPMTKRDRADYLHADAMTVSGRSLQEKPPARRSAGQGIAPLAPDQNGGLVI